MQPILEGVYIPIIEGYSKMEEELSYLFSKHGDGATTNGIGLDDANAIDKLLAKYKFSDCLKIDRTRLKESHEAWVFVEVFDDEGNDKVNTMIEGARKSGGIFEVMGEEMISQMYGSLRLFGSFAPYPRVGVLTWPNSD